MAALIWGAWSSDWELRSRVEFNGESKTITVHPGVTSLDIRADVYSAWVDWLVLRDNTKYQPAIRYAGYDPIGGGQFTGDTYFLTSGWKLLVNVSQVRITGVLFSDDYDTAYYTPALEAQYPATVSSLVNTVTIVGTEAVTALDLWNYNNRSLSVAPPTAEQIADAAWAHSFANKLLTVAKFLGLK